MKATWEELTYLSEGEQVRAFAVSPPGGGEQVPAVVLAPGRDRNVRALAWLAEALADAGFFIFGITYRDRETRYHRSDIEDVRAAVSYLLTERGGRQIGVIGHSRGGSAVLGAAARDPRIGSVVALAPITDHVRYVRGLQQYAPTRFQAMTSVRGGTPEEVPDYYREISAVEHAGTITAPVLLVHGSLDLVVPMEHSQWMAEALRRAGNPRVRLEILTDVGHFFERTFEGYVFDQVSALCVHWLRETLSAQTVL